MRGSIPGMWLAVAVLPTVAPVRAHAGDVIHVDVVIENKAEGMRTTNAELLVNGKAVARQLFTWGTSAGERLYRLSFDWDTRGIPPGGGFPGGEAAGGSATETDPRFGKSRVGG